jgi:hypothetical protein
MFKTSRIGRKEVLIGYASFISVFNFCPAILDAFLLGISETFIRSMSTLIVNIVLYQEPLLSVVKSKAKVKITPEQDTKVQRGSRYSSTLSLTSALEVGGWSTPRPGRFTPGKDPVPLYRRLVGLQGRSGQVRKISPSTGFDPRTVQPAASR